MTHHDDLVLRRDELPQRLRLYAGLYTGILGHLFLFATEICDAVAVFDHRLVAAAGKGQIDSHTGELIAQGVSRRVQARPMLSVAERAFPILTCFTSSRIENLSSAILR